MEHYSSQSSGQPSAQPPVQPSAQSASQLASQIATTIEQQIRPFVERDGGSIAFHAFEDGVVYVTMTGACSSCAAVSITLKSGVERTLRKAFREVKSVALWQQ
jgi:Fe-S cluster biogenesis protein NfuA